MELVYFICKNSEMPIGSWLMRLSYTLSNSDITQDDYTYYKIGLVEDREHS